MTVSALSIELAGKRATLAETGAWIKSLRMYLRDLLSREVDARHNTEDGHDACLRQCGLLQRSSSCTNTRAPQNLQTAAEVHSLVAVETDEHEIARIKMQCAALKQTATKCSPPPAKLVKRMARGVVLAAEPGPSGWRHCGHWTL